MATATDSLQSPELRAQGACHPLRVVTTEQLAALGEAWRTLAERQASPIGQFAWIAACAETLAAEGSLRVLALADDDELLAAAPLVSQLRRGIRRLAHLGVSQLHEPMDLLWTDDAALQALARALVRDGSPLDLGRLPDDSPAIAALRAAARGRALVVVRPQARCPVIHLDETWLEPERQLNSGRRSDLRRARRRAEQLGATVTEILTPRADQLDELLDVALKVEASSWKGETGTALAHDASRASFFRRYAAAACDEGILRICLLRIDSQPAAMQIAVEHRGGFWLLKVGYDEQFARCSPGQLLMCDTIRHAAERGLQTYEFLGSAETWTATWTETERGTVSVQVYPFTARGLAALAVDGAAGCLRRGRTRS